MKICLQLKDSIDTKGFEIKSKFTKRHTTCPKQLLGKVLDYEEVEKNYKDYIFGDKYIVAVDIVEYIKHMDDVCWPIALLAVKYDVDVFLNYDNCYSKSVIKFLECNYNTSVEVSLVNA